MHQIPPSAAAALAIALLLAADPAAAASDDSRPEQQANAGSDDPGDDQPLDPAQPADVERLEAEVRDLAHMLGGLKQVYDGGFTLRSADDNFRLDIGGRIQPRYEFTGREHEEDLSSFYLRRVRLDIRGHAFTDQLTFRIMPELARTANLRDGWLNYAFEPMLQVRAGQFTVPFHWQRSVSGGAQHFAERSVVGSTLGFPNGYDIGVSVHGQNSGRNFAWAVGVFDGAGRNVQFSNSVGHLYSGRVSWAPLGNIPREESDLAWSEEVNWSIGGGVQGANRNEVRAWDLGLSPVGNSRADWIAGTLDTRIAFRGFSLAADGYLRWVDPDDPMVDDYTGWGYMASAGYFVIRERLELVGRFSQLRLDRDLGETEVTEWGVGLNIYHRGHNWKTRVNFLQEEADAGDTFRVIVEHHLQF